LVEGVATTYGVCYNIVMRYTITSEKTTHYDIVVEAENREEAETILHNMDIEDWENSLDESRQVYVQESWSGTEWEMIEDE
jgi:hypothetical protein